MKFGPPDSFPLQLHQLLILLPLHVLYGIVQWLCNRDFISNLPILLRLNLQIPKQPWHLAKL